MAAGGHAVFDFGTEGTLGLRFNALWTTMVVPTISQDWELPP